MTSLPLTANAEALKRSYPPIWLATVVWSIAALFYLTGFYQRVSPGVMTDELMRSFGISAAALGTLSASYFYAYVAMQIPTGLLVDSWGARKLLIWGAAAAAMGTFIFGFTSNLTVACLGRAIIGGSTAIAWVVLLKLATHWYRGQRFAMLSGLGLLIGNLGALVAQIPLRVLINHFAWREVVFGSGAISLCVGLLAFAFVKDDPSEEQFESYAPLTLQNQNKSGSRVALAGLRTIFAYRNTWLIFLAQGAMVGAVLSFTGLWGTPYLKARFGLTATTGASVCSLMIICWAIASPLCGALSDRIGRRKPIHFSGCIAATIGWGMLFYLPGLTLGMFIVLAALTSVASGAVVLGFAYSKESVPIRFLGTISGVTNIGNMIGPMLLQPGIGWMLDKNWNGAMGNGVRIYDLPAFQPAFALVVVWLILACVLLGFTKETYCANRTE